MSVDELFPSFGQKEKELSLLDRIVTAQEKSAGITPGFSDLEIGLISGIVSNRTGKVWKRKVYKTASNSSSTCPALDSNAEGVASPFTDTAAGSDPYMDNYRVFKWSHCNYTRDSDGTARISALDGMPGYASTGSADVGTVLPTFYWAYNEHDTYYELIFSDSPHEELGLVPWCMAVKYDGTVLPYFVVSSYASIVASDGKLRSQPGKPANNASYDNNVTNYQAKGSGYWGGGLNINTLCLIYLIIKYQTKNESYIFQGNNTFYKSVAIAYAETGTKRALVAAGSGFQVGDGVTIGAKDSCWLNGSLVSWAKVLKVESVSISGTTYDAVTLDVSAAFDTTTALYLCGSACPSGQTDAVIGHYDGSYLSNTDAKHAFRIEGIEMMNGLWNVASDTVFDFLADSWRVYVADKGTAHVKDAHAGYRLIGTCDAFKNDQWVGNVMMDLASGAFYHKDVGSGSSLGTGAHHWNGGTGVTDGTLRECLSLGGLHNGSTVGLCNLYGWHALSDADVDVGSRD